MSPGRFTLSVSVTMVGLLSVSAAVIDSVCDPLVTRPELERNRIRGPDQIAAGKRGRIELHDDGQHAAGIVDRDCHADPDSLPCHPN